MVRLDIPIEFEWIEGDSWPARVATPDAAFVSHSPIADRQLVRVRLAWEEADAGIAAQLERVWEQSGRGAEPVLYTPLAGGADLELLFLERGLEIERVGPDLFRMRAELVEAA